MNLLKVSVSGAVFIFAVVIIRAAAINHLPKKTFLVLWEAILLRLMLPFEIPSMFRAYTLMNRRISAFSYLEAEIDSITSAIASSDGSSNGYMTSVVRNLQTNAKAGSMSIIHESAEILYYEDGEPYIHDILTNHTDQTIVETQYCMLAKKRKMVQNLEISKGIRLRTYCSV